jgi:hypothetical protein
LTVKEITAKIAAIKFVLRDVFSILRQGILYLVVPRSGYHKANSIADTGAVSKFIFLELIGVGKYAS